MLKLSIKAEHQFAELDDISRVKSHFSPHFLLIILIYFVCALVMHTLQTGLDI